MRLLAQARNPYSLQGLWIPGSRYARPGMTNVMFVMQLASGQPMSRNTASTTLRSSDVSAACGAMGSPTL